MKPIHKNRKMLEVKYQRQASELGMVPGLHVIVKLMFKMPLLKRFGLQNALNVGLNQIELQLKDLPARFAGCKILFITDMHLGGIECLAEKINRIAGRVEYDYCILGGDYSFGFDATNEFMNEQLREVIEFLVERSEVFGILGNHDVYRIAEVLDGFGVNMVINEHVCLERKGDKVYLSGVDDCYFFHADELDEAAAGIPDDAFKIIVSHSPDLYKQAELAGYSLYLAGHTHGGQICLPGEIAVITHAHVPRNMIKGRWKCKSMEGYTSSGAGISLVPARFFCQPEVVLLTLVNDSNTE
jgi:predicted MPP superfamily phosphohydrolase